MKDLAQDVAEDVLGAAEDGGVKMLILPIAIFQRHKPRPTRPYRPPTLPVKDGHVEDTARDVVEDVFVAVPRNWAHDLLIFRTVPRKPSSREFSAESHKLVDQKDIAIVSTENICRSAFPESRCVLLSRSSEDEQCWAPRRIGS